MKFYQLHQFPQFEPPEPHGDRFAGLRFWLTTILVIWGLSALGLGWIVDSIFILLGLAIAAPVIAFIGFQWWIKSKIVTADCPVCSYTFTAAKDSQLQCPSCGEPLQVEKSKFVRLTPPGTIDVEVQAVD